MVWLVNDPSLVIRSVLSVLTVAVAVGTIAGSIAVGVVIGRLGTPFTTSEVVVLKSPATVVLNRLILPNEVPLFYNVLETMNVSAIDIKTALTGQFGSQFLTVQFQSFSATPNVTLNDARDSFIRGQSLSEPYGTDVITTWKPAVAKPSLAPNTTRGKVVTWKDSGCTNYTIVVTPCSLDGDGVHVCNDKNKYNLSCSEDGADRIACVRNVTASENCNCNTSSLSIDCKNLTVMLTDCFDGAYKNFCQSLNDTTLSTTAIATNSTRTSTAVSLVTTSTTVPMTTPPCDNSTNGTGQSSIIISQMFLFFKVKSGGSIAVEDIVNALSNIQPPVALLTTGRQASVGKSSFNRTLSRVEQPSPVNLNPDALVAEPSISTELANNVTAAANAAAQNFTYTTTVGTPFPVTTPTLLG